MLIGATSSFSKRGARATGQIMKQVDRSVICCAGLRVNRPTSVYTTGSLDVVVAGADMSVAA